MRSAGTADSPAPDNLAARDWGVGAGERSSVDMGERRWGHDVYVVSSRVVGRKTSHARLQQPRSCAEIDFILLRMIAGAARAASHAALYSYSYAGLAK